MTTTDDVFDLAPHEVEPDVEPERIASEASELPDEVGNASDDPLGDPTKLPFLSWLWHHHVPGDEFYPLAHLVLSGGPGDVWARKTFLLPSFVAGDIAEFYAVGRPGITEEHLDLARKAGRAWAASTETVSELVAKRRREFTRRNGGGNLNGEPASIGIAVKAAQTEGFLELGTVPASNNANNSSASIYEVVPKVDPDSEVMPTNFRSFKVRCVYTDSQRGLQGNQHIGPKGNTESAKMCGRPSVAGSMLCARHGGVPLAYTHEELKEIYDGARQRLIAATLMAVDATIDLAQNSTNDMVRLKAAEVILDRTGFVPGVEIHLPGQSRVGSTDKTPAQIILERLEQLGIATPTVVPANGSADIDDSDVVEAEVVGE
jgi:K+-transporting ATPase c subunit